MFIHQKTITASEKGSEKTLQEAKIELDYDLQIGFANF
jgi:hypothetical protein